MEVVKMNIDKLRPADYNPRKDLKPGDKEYENIKKSIEKFGYVEPITWNKRTGNIVGGHQRVKVLKELGHTEIDAVIIDIDEMEEKALNVALNKISGAWDDEKLKDLLNEINEFDYEIELTGFSESELMELNFEKLGEKEKEEKDNPPTMRIIFEEEKDFRSMEEDLRKLIDEKYKNARVSILAGEL